MVTWWRRMPRVARVAIVLVCVVALVRGLMWWNYPAHRIERALHRLDFPPAIQVTDEDVVDEGWLCIDACSSGDRWYVTSLSSADTAATIAAAMGDDGWEVESNPCGEFDICTRTELDPYAVNTVEWILRLQGHGFMGTVEIGTRADGRRGVSLSLIKD